MLRNELFNGINRIEQENSTLIIQDGDDVLATLMGMIRHDISAEVHVQFL